MVFQGVFIVVAVDLVGLELVPVLVKAVKVKVKLVLV
jgi:hypothetical protein